MGGARLVETYLSLLAWLIINEPEGSDSTPSLRSDGQPRHPMSWRLAGVDSLAGSLVLELDQL